MSMTEEQMKTMIEKAVEKRETQIRAEYRNIIPKFGGRKEEKVEDYLFQLEIWMETTPGNKKNKNAMIISGLSGEALETIKSIPKDELLGDEGYNAIVCLLYTSPSP